MTTMQTYEQTTPTGYTYTVQLTDEEAERRGLKSAPKAETKRAPKPENKAQDEDRPSQRTVTRPGAAPRRK